MRLFDRFFISMLLGLFLSSPHLAGFFTLSHAEERKNTPPAVPVNVAAVQKKAVSDRISLIGTTEPFRESIVASEVSGLVGNFNVTAGDFVNKGKSLAVLGATGSRLRLKGAMAAHAGIQSRLILAEKELQRVSHLKNTHSVTARQYDEVFYSHRMLEQELLKNEADIEQLEYEISQKDVRAPFTGFVAAEHTQMGEWVNIGGPVVTLVDMSRILIKVDVPETYVVNIRSGNKVQVVISSLDKSPLSASISTILPKGDSNARTFPVHIHLTNKDFKIKSGMAASVTFSVGKKRTVMLLPKDAIVASGNQRLVYVVDNGHVAPVSIKVVGYYDNDAAIQGSLEPGQLVVTRGNERLRPGQAVRVID